MTTKPTRTRIAPSPTGEFHIGSLRTLLYNYAWAKKNHGQFLIRIEDTDRNRFVPGAINRMLEVIKDYGFDWDEGPSKEGSCGPYIQSERLNIYREYVDRLVTNKKAYYCFCSHERLEDLRNKAQSEGKSFKYDRYCLSLNEVEIKSKIDAGEQYVIRMRVPDNEIVSFEDIVLGNVSIPTNEIDDQVLMKSDGYPTYHFAVVIDDYLMKISHVLRGGEWIPSTPKHVLLYQFFGFEVPKFGHLPNLKFLGSNKKMSKREGNTAAVMFLKEGYLPEAVINYLMFLGWNPGTEKEIYTLNEFIEDFDLNKIHTTDLVTFDIEKLNWFNSEYIKKLSNKEFFDMIKNWSAKFNVPCLISEIENKYSEEQVLSICRLTKERLQVLGDFNSLVDYYLQSPNLDSIILGKYSSNPRQVLTFFLDLIEQVEDFSFSNLDELLHKKVKENSYSMKEYFMTLRICITGEIVTPPIIEIISILGKEETIYRLKKSLSLL